MDKGKIYESVSTGKLVAALDEMDRADSDAKIVRGILAGRKDAVEKIAALENRSLVAALFDPASPFHGIKFPEESVRAVIKANADVPYGVATKVTSATYGPSYSSWDNSTSPGGTSYYADAELTALDIKKFDRLCAMAKDAQQFAPKYLSELAPAISTLFGKMGEVFSAPSWDSNKRQDVGYYDKDRVQNALDFLKKKMEWGKEAAAMADSVQRLSAVSSLSEDSVFTKAVHDLAVTLRKQKVASLKPETVAEINALFSLPALAKIEQTLTQEAKVRETLEALKATKKEVTVPQLRQALASTAKADDEIAQAIPWKKQEFGTYASGILGSVTETLVTELAAKSDNAGLSDLCEVIRDQRDLSQRALKSYVATGATPKQIASFAAKLG